MRACRLEAACGLPPWSPPGTPREGASPKAGASMAEDLDEGVHIERLTYVTYRSSSSSSPIWVIMMAYDIFLRYCARRCLFARIEFAPYCIMLLHLEFDE
eukprot:3258185-Amphidinium_carterae.1